MSCHVMSCHIITLQTYGIDYTTMVGCQIRVWSMVERPGQALGNNTRCMCQTNLSDNN